MKVVLLGLVLTFFGLSQAKDELVGVVIMYRHGDRTPLSFYPTDPYQDSSFWQEGPGQLTNEGKQRHYELGQWFRARYSGFLSEKYSNEEFRIASTDMDRTLMSAASNLAGLYPPKNNQIWNNYLLWQPIPIHIIPESLTKYETCPKFDILYAETLLQPPFSTIDSENEDLYEFLANQTGSLVLSFVNVNSIFDTLYVEDRNNLTLPAWTQGVFPDQMQPMSDAVFQAVGYSDSLSRLSAGPFLNTVIEHFEKISKGEKAEKMLVFSAHDSNLASVLGGLKAFEHHAPFYSSSILFELRRNEQNEHFVNVFYKNTAEPKPLEVRGCSVNCLLDEFKERLVNVTISSAQWARECFLPGVNKTKKLVK